MESLREINYDLSLNLQEAREARNDIYFQSLLVDGSNTHTRKTNGYTPLQIALLIDDIKMVRFLLETGADPNQSFFHGNWKGYSPLHFALILRSSAMAILLIAYGANIFALSHYRIPIIYFAIKFNRIRVIHYLIDNGLSPDTLITDQFSLLTYAVVKGNINIIKCILNHRPNVNLYQHQQVIVKAIYTHANRSKKLVKMLYKYGFTLPLAEINSDLIIAAIDNGHYEAVRNLLELGVSPNFEIITKARKEENILHHAVMAEEPKIVRLLLEYGANVHLRNSSGKTPILIAAKKNNLCIIKLLLKYGASVKDVDSHNCTVLHCTIMEQPDWIYNNSNWHVDNKKTTIIKLFISLGAEVNIKTKNTWSYPLHFAAQIGLPGVVQMLLANGAQVDEPNCTNKTPLELIQSQMISLNIRMDINNTLESDAPSTLSMLVLTTFRLLQHHVYQLHRIGLSVGSINLVENNNNIFRLNDNFRKIIDDEINFIKETKIGNTHITLYHFLTSTDEGASKLIRNDDILHDLQTMLKFPSKFSEYALLMRNKLKAALTKKKLDNVLFELMNLFIKEKKLPTLPDECIEHIISFLNNKDKEIVIDQFVK